MSVLLFLHPQLQHFRRTGERQGQPRITQLDSAIWRTLLSWYEDRPQAGNTASLEQTRTSQWMRGMPRHCCELVSFAATKRFLQKQTKSEALSRAHPFFSARTFRKKCWCETCHFASFGAALLLPFFRSEVALRRSPGIERAEIKRMESELDKQRAVGFYLHLPEGPS